jgi:hypothetical protein
MPPELTVAKEVFEDVHVEVLVTSAVLPLSRRAVAVN